MARRGSMLDLGYLAAFIFAFIIIVLISRIAINGVMPQLNATLYNTNNTAVQTAADNLNTNIVGSSDVLIGMLPVAVVLVGLAAVVAAAFIPTSPIFFPIALVSLSLFVVLGMTLSNSLSTILSAPTFVAIANANPILVNIAQYLPHIVVAFGALVLIVMYVAHKNAGGGATY